MRSPTPVASPALSAPTGIAVQPAGLIASTDPFFPEWRTAPSVVPTPAVGTGTPAAHPLEHTFPPLLGATAAPAAPAVAGALLHNLSGSTTPPGPAEASFEDLLFGGVPAAPVSRQLDDAAQWSVTRAPTAPPPSGTEGRRPEEGLPLVVGAKLVQPAAGQPAPDAWAVTGPDDLKKP